MNNPNESGPQAELIATGANKNEDALSTPQSPTDFTRGFKLLHDLRDVVAQATQECSQKGFLASGVGTTGGPAVPVNTIFFLADEASGRLIGLASVLVNCRGKIISNSLLFCGPGPASLENDLIECLALSRLRDLAQKARAVWSYSDGFKVVSEAAERRGVPNPLESLRRKELSD
jgi:hypothetical protein